MYYNNCENLPLYNWEKYQQTKDNNWFIVGYDGRQPKVTNDDLVEIEKNIVDEFILLSKDMSFVFKIQKLAKIDALVSKYNVIRAICKRVASGNVSDENLILFYDALKAFRLKFDVLDIETINRILNEIQGIETQINILKKELDSETSKKTLTLNKQMRFVEVGLGLAYKLDKKIITVSEWFDLLEMLKDKKND